MRRMLSHLVGKIVERIVCDEYEEVVVIHFTDGSFYVAVARWWNCCGARLLQKVHLAETTAMDTPSGGGEAD